MPTLIHDPIDAARVDGYLSKLGDLAERASVTGQAARDAVAEDASLKDRLLGGDGGVQASDLDLSAREVERTSLLARGAATAHHTHKLAAPVTDVSLAEAVAAALQHPSVLPASASYGSAPLDKSPARGSLPWLHVWQNEPHRQLGSGVVSGGVYATFYPKGGTERPPASDVLRKHLEAVNGFKVSEVYVDAAAEDGTYPMVIRVAEAWPLVPDVKVIPRYHPTALVPWVNRWVAEQLALRGWGIFVADAKRLLSERVESDVKVTHIGHRFTVFAGRGPDPVARVELAEEIAAAAVAAQVGTLLPEGRVASARVVEVPEWVGQFPPASERHPVDPADPNSSVAGRLVTVHAEFEAHAKA